MRLIPKDEGFFDLFDRLAAHIVKSADVLHSLFNEPAQRDRYAAVIKEVEHQADEITHEIMNRLDRSFVTPLDREDIHELANTLDNVVDLIDGTARRVQMFHVTDRREPATQLTAILKKCAVLIAEAVTQLKDSAEIVRIGQQMKLLEQEGDALFSSAVGDLFDGSPNPLDVIKWKELYDNIEHAIDECEDVLNVLESVSLKNG